MHRLLLHTLLLGTTALMLGACSIKRLLPEGPALSPREQASFSASPPPSGVQYGAPPWVEAPILPLQIWGLHYAIDIVLVSDHPHWSMHEYARVDLPQGSLWLAKDADPDGDQVVVADLDDIRGWVPEIPVQRHRATLQAIDHSDDRRVDLQLTTETPLGEPVELSFHGRRPQRATGKRNGSTMEHSRQAVAARQDQAGKAHGGEVALQIGGEERRIRRLLGLYRMSFVLDQVQAGFAVASFQQRPSAQGFELQRPAPGVEWPSESLESWEDDGQSLRRRGDVVTLEYDFPATDSAQGSVRELHSARVFQAGHEDPILVLRLDRALPDLRRPFQGRSSSRFVLDVNGQAAHGTGTIECWWTDQGPMVQMLPSAPWWLAERPMLTSVRFEEQGAVRVGIQRTEPVQKP